MTQSEFRTLLTSLSSSLQRLKLVKGKKNAKAVADVRKSMKEIQSLSALHVTVFGTAKTQKTKMAALQKQVKKTLGATSSRQLSQYKTLARKSVKALLKLL